MDLSTLNPKQQEAVTTTEGPLLIFAGAGSGKTRVLVHRMAYLIQERGVKPWQIFAVTFTNKAAGEMKERVGQLLGQRADSLWISTFHSAGVKILRAHIERLKMSPNFVIFDDSEQQTLIKNCLQELDLNPKIFNPRSMGSKIDGAKNELITPEEFPTDDFMGERVAKVYALYQKKLEENNALDFGDLLMKTVKLFEENPDVLKLYTDRFHYLMVDEYQDTNHAQYRLVKLLASDRGNLCVVGDDDQSIYRWRGADVRNILDFHQDFPAAQVIKLEQNYRSTQNILNAAGEIVKGIEGRAQKTLWTENPEGEVLTLCLANTDRHEADFVVGEIQKALEAGTPLNQMAIFYRTNAQSRVLEDSLRRQNIPYVIYGGVRFYDRMEIKDILAYLWVLHNPQDGLHLKRILNVPARGIGKTSVEKLEHLAISQGISLFQALSYADQAGIATKTAKKLLNFVMLLENLKTRLSSQSLSDFVQALMEAIGYLEALKLENTIESESRLENLEELIRVVEEYESQAVEPSLADFLEQVALVNAVDNLDDRQNSLPMMTLHLAKGLEFDRVFMVGMEEGLLPHSRSLDTPEELDEERRLTYVGMTRARKKLYLSHSERRRLYGGERYQLASRFLDEVPEHLVEKKRVPELAPLDFEASFSHQNSRDYALPDREQATPYQIGVRVNHPSFGIGVIRKSEGALEKRKLIVEFPRVGYKKLIAQLSNLTIVN
ncbi:MAG: UvrD-helicase domain-containing protein [Deltaproteobacteria bacterium]|nr:UvrD-helicase domain-containing protein [Deltaproteobacteria bacterium]